MNATSDVLFGHSVPEHYILVQLTPEIADKEICIKSASANSSVLCTPTSTFQLKDVQQSNLLLFLSDSGSQELVLQGEAASWLETTLQHKPRIDLACIPIYDGMAEVQGIEPQALFSRLPASSAEIEIALVNNLCLELDQGYVRLEPGYVLRLLKLLLNTILAEGMETTSFKIGSIQECLQNEDESQDVLYFLLKHFSVLSESGEQHGPYTDIQGYDSRAYKLDELGIVRYTGIATLLLHAQTPISTINFVAMWTEATPKICQGLCKDVNILIGNYIQPVSTQMQHFARDELSADGKQRINQLLKVKERWAEADLLPFLDDLDGGLKMAQTLIMKHARKVKVGKTTFIERRGK